MQIRKDDEQTIIRIEQERKQNRCTRPRKKKNIKYDVRLNNLKMLYEQQSIDIKHYQSKIRCIGYTYIDALQNTPDNTDTD